MRRRNTITAVVFLLAVAAGFVFLGPVWVAERWDALRRRRLDRGRREK